MRAFIQMLSIAWVAVTISLAHGGTFKWIDSQGRTHYGDTPPQSVKAKPVDTGECQTAGCQRELEQRRQETVAAYRELEAWLDRRAERRASVPSSQTIVYRQVYTPGFYTKIDEPWLARPMRGHQPHRHAVAAHHGKGGRGLTRAGARAHGTTRVPVRAPTLERLAVRK